jgi:hypothetical protein
MANTLGTNASGDNYITHSEKDRRKIQVFLDGDTAVSYIYILQEEDSMTRGMEAGNAT